MWEDRLRYDLEYLDRISFLEDVKIIFLTVACLFRHSDVATDGMATSEDYGDYLLRIGAVNSGEYTKRQKEAEAALSMYR